MNEVLQHEQLAWFVARSSGVVTLLLSAAAIVWGLLLSSKVLDGTPSPKRLLNMHRYLGTLTVVFTGVHLVALAADNWVHFGWAELLIPFASEWKPGAVAWGIVAGYLLVAVQISSLLMSRIPRRWWKRIHVLSYLMFWTGIVHGVQAGTDADSPAYIGGSAFLVVLIVFLTCYRIITAKRTTGRASETRSSNALLEAARETADVG